MWYRKLSKNSHIAELCGVGLEFSKVGEYIHEDDIQEIQKFLEVNDACMDLLFIRDEIPYSD